MTKPVSPRDQFTVAPYAVNGEAQGRGTWRITDLSPKWIDVCSDLIRANGASFDTKLYKPLDQLRVECVSANGSALITISAHDRPASLAAFASGNSDISDAKMLAMFADSIKRSSVQFSKHSEGEAFADVATLPDRPLLVVVPWPDSLISDQENELAKELMLHFAAAFLQHTSLSA